MREWNTFKYQKDLQSNRSLLAWYKHEQSSNGAYSVIRGNGNDTEAEPETSMRNFIKKEEVDF